MSYAISPDIVSKIVAERRKDLEILGPNLGHSIPKERERKIIPFLDKKGAILEIKRASPSKGDIAPDLDPIALAQIYKKAGAKQVSVLTEERHFKGSLKDLLLVGQKVPDLSYLRKDFLLEEEEIDISFRAGADAVLLIARILSSEKLFAMVERARSFGIMPFIELRDREDGEKIAGLKEGPVLFGVNARDLSSFKVDPLSPAEWKERFARNGLSAKPPMVYESGIHFAPQAHYAGELGFNGILVGEASARKPSRAAELVQAFLGAKENRRGLFWRQVAIRREEAKNKRKDMPLIKVCGLKEKEDAILAHRLGADMLGFVFAESPRIADATSVRTIYTSLKKEEKPPLLIGVIRAVEDAKSKEAIALAEEGILNALQYHGPIDAPSLEKMRNLFQEKNIAYYLGVGLENEKGIPLVKEILKKGEPRLLLDASRAGVSGGTGESIPLDLLKDFSDGDGLWLAGGLGPGNTKERCLSLRPELLDASSGLEESPGKKSEEKMRTWFKEIFDAR